MIIQQVHFDYLRLMLVLQDCHVINFIAAYYSLYTWGSVIDQSLEITVSGGNEYKEFKAITPWLLYCPQNTLV